MIDPLTNLVWRVQDTPVLEIRYTLDLLGHVTQRVDRSGGAVLAVRDYGYDGLDRLASEAHASGYAATYAYDDAGRRTAKETARFGVAYTAGTGDRLAGWEVTRTNTWTFQVSGFSSEDPATNPAYRFLEVRNGVETVAPGMTGSNFTAALTARTLGTQTVIVAISDAAGNVGVATSAFVRTAFTAGEYSADAAGCVTQTVYRGPSCREERTLTWDAQYRLTAAATNGAPAESYGYDPLGRRMWTEAGGVTNLHLYDGAHLLADLDVTGGVVRSYVYGPEIDERGAMTIHTGDVPRTFYALRDHQNTVWAWVDESGNVAESYDYDAWGRVLGIYDGEGASMAQSAIGNRFLFQGREYSFATGLYHFRARWYDPVTGRWLSNDLIGISGGLNQYVFCGNNPVNYVDPRGLCTDDDSDPWRALRKVTEIHATPTGWEQTKVAWDAMGGLDGFISIGMMSVGGGGGSVKFLSADQAARQLGVTPKVWHRVVKERILKDAAKVNPKVVSELGAGNADVGWTREGQIWLKNVATGVAKATDLLVEWYKDLSQ